MAYNSHNLSVLAYSNGFTLWHYRTEDTPEEVTAYKYFEPAADMLRAGDMLLINFAGPSSDGLYVVDSWEVGAWKVVRCV